MTDQAPPLPHVPAISPDVQNGVGGLKPDSVASGNANLVYILYLVSLATGVAGIVGLIMAYVYTGTAAPWVETHFRFQIRTFWIGTLYSFISILCTFILIGWLMLLVALVWYIVRNVKGMQRLAAGLPVENPTTWWW
jgi:uncharacterized membrane protein